MGVRGLYHYCKKYLHNPNYDKKLRIGIDSSSLIYRFHGNLDKIYEFLQPILQNKLLFVLEGKAPEYKSEETINGLALSSKTKPSSRKLNMRLS